MDDHVTTREGSRMKYRKLRIAWSVAWGVACLLLIAFLVRSYWWNDFLFVRPPAPITGQLESYEGALYFRDLSQMPSKGTRPGIGWTLRSNLYPRTSIPPFNKIFRWFDRPNSFTFQVPVWFLTLVPAAFAFVPWLPRQYSLRTLLISMTVVAVGLGWIVYALRS